MRPARILLLLVALVAGGLAAWLATRGDGPAPQVATQTQVVEEPKVQILVAKQAIGMAERLSPTNVEWIDWPQGSIRDEYVTMAKMPDAVTKMAGTVARFEFFPGEPIREDKLVHTDQGYLSAVLAKGMRGVSIPVAAASGSGGFIVPNDRVDVVQTRATAAGQLSQVILSNVRVLAIGQRLGETGATGASGDPAAAQDTAGGPKAQIFADSTIATLELDPSQADTLIQATATGTISLTLRSVADFNEVAGEAQKSNNAPIRVIRYGSEASVLSGSTNQNSGVSAAAAELAAASYTPQITVTPGAGMLVQPNVGTVTNGPTPAPASPPPEAPAVN